MGIGCTPALSDAPATAIHGADNATPSLSLKEPALRKHLIGLTLLATLGACQTAPNPAPPAPPQSGADDAVLVLHSLRVERAYTLEDPRDDAFRAQIRADALVVCGRTGFAIHSQRPIGPEVIGDAFLFRDYEITYACTG